MNNNLPKVSNQLFLKVLNDMLKNVKANYITLFFDIFVC